MKKKHNYKTPDSDIRFKRPGVEDGWLYGTSYLLRSTGILDVFERHTGGLYSIDPRHAQKRVYGPRGGKSWVPFTEAQDEEAKISKKE